MTGSRITGTRLVAMATPPSIAPFDVIIRDLTRQG